MIGRGLVAVLAWTALMATAACVVRPTQFDRYLSAERWVDAAREFTADTSLRSNEDALYRAALLFATPGRSPYDTTKARTLFTMLLARFPSTKYAPDATAHLRLLDEMLRAQQDAAAKERELETRISALTQETHDLQMRIDSTATQTDSLRATVTRLEADRKDRDDQLKALRLELQRLKDIDLKPRPPIKP